MYHKGEYRRTWEESALKSRKEHGFMKKIYETPICQTVITSDEDILTASKFINFAEKKEGSFDDSDAVVYW